jgi:ABC-2 type transport system ATP-binding protein
MNEILVLNGVCKQYETFALKDISFSIPKGYIMGFIGPNGAGKTTTIKCILGMINADAGSIHVFGQDLSLHALAIKEQIGVVMDYPFYVEDWNMEEVGKALKPFYPKWDEKRFADCLHRFGLAPKKKVSELSRGMKVKLMLSVALSHDAKLLILD